MKIRLAKPRPLLRTQAHAGPHAATRHGVHRTSSRFIRQSIDGKAYFRAQLEQELNTPITAEISIFRRVQDLENLLKGESFELSPNERLHVLSSVFGEHFKRVEAERIEVYSKNARLIADREAELSPGTLRDARLEELLAQSYRDTYRFDLELLVGLVLSKVFSAQYALLRAGKPLDITHKKDIEARREIALQGDVSVPLVLIDHHNLRLNLFTEFTDALISLLVIHSQMTQKSGEVASGPDYNRNQGNLLKAAKLYVQAANKRLPKNQRIELDSIFAGSIPPYQYPESGKANFGSRLDRARRVAGVYILGGAVNRAVSAFKAEHEGRTYPLITGPKDVPAKAGFQPWNILSPITREIWFRIFFDRAAHRHLEPLRTNFNRLDIYDASSALSILRHTYDQKTGLTNWDSPEYLRALRANAGREMFKAADLTPHFEYAPGAEELCRQLAAQYEQELGRPATVLFTPTHHSLFDQMAYLRMIPGSSLDKMFGGQPGLAAIVARADYDKTVKWGRLAYTATDQESLFNVLLINMNDPKPLIRFSKDRMEGHGEHAMLFPVGGRNPFNHSHNPLVPAGLNILASSADLVIPLGITNSGDGLPGGEVRLIVEKPIEVRHYNVKKGKRINKITDLNALTHLIHYRQRAVLETIHA